MIDQANNEFIQTLTESDQKFEHLVEFAFQFSDTQFSRFVETQLENN